MKEASQPLNSQDAAADRKTAQPLDYKATARVNKDGKPYVNFDAIEESPKFRELVRSKKRFLVPAVVLFLSLYILFPLLISYTNWLHQPFIADISWSWVYAFGLFIMTWTLVTIYMRKAAKFDQMASDVLNESGYSEGDGVQ